MLINHSCDEKEFLGNQSKTFSEIRNKCSVESLAQQWAKRYLQKLQVDADEEKTNNPLNLTDEGNFSHEQAAECYIEQVASYQLATVLGADVGNIRKKYTSLDPRRIGFVSMQFHYTSQMLAEPLSSWEHSLVGAYFKVIDDHLYMLLQRT